MNESILYIVFPHLSIDKEEEQKRGEMREIAKKELDDWYKHHGEQMEKTKDNNR